MKKFRKYLQPIYGEPSPEVIIGAPQEMDMNNPEVSRNKIHMESIAEFTDLMKRCHCYEPMMQVETKDLFVKNKDYSVPIRVYSPVEKKSDAIMTFYHGGGWVMNNIEVYDYVCRYFARYGGFTVVSVQYRLAPENPYPIPLEDCYAALNWVYDHAEELGANKNKLSVCGDSAGGNFATAMCLMSRDKKGPSIKSQVLFYPATVLKTSYRLDSEKRYGDGGYFLEVNFETGMTPSSVYVPNDEDAISSYASPLLSEDLSNLPPACFLSAECDPLLDQALMYAAALEDANVHVEYNLYKGMIHGFMVYPYQKTFESLDTAIDFINS